MTSARSGASARQADKRLGRRGEAAAQAREAELRRLGLHGLARLQAVRASADARETARTSLDAEAADCSPLAA